MLFYNRDYYRIAFKYTGVSMIDMVKQLPRGVVNVALVVAGCILWQGCRWFIDHQKQEYEHLGNQVQTTMTKIEDTNRATNIALARIQKDITALQLDVTKLRAEMLTPERVKIMIRAEIGKYHSLKGE